MLKSQEIFEFFKDFPKEIRTRCIEEVLVFGVRTIQKMFGYKVSATLLMQVNEDQDRARKKNLTPEFKTRKTLKSIEFNKKKKRERLVKENACPDTTCLPLKNDRRAQTVMLSEFEKYITETCVMKQSAFNESLDKEKEVIRLADEFLKNPFTKSLSKHKAKASSPGILLDSNIFSTIEMMSPQVYFDL